MLIVGIAIAGAAGALSRWGLGQLMLAWGATRYPYGTLSANLLGCFILGFITELAERAQWMTGEMRVVIGVGFVGALTTFSTWEFETMRLARRGDMISAAGNFIINVVLGYAMLWLSGRAALLLTR